MSLRPLRSRSGFTLVELLCVLVLVLVLASLAAPSFRDLTTRVRTRSALDRITADVAYTRMLAIRSGTRATLRFTRRSPECYAPTYALVVMTTPARTAKQTVLDVSADTCIDLGTVDSIAFNSRGLPVTVNNRRVSLRRGAIADSLTISSLGRVFRWY